MADRAYADPDAARASREASRRLRAARRRLPPRVPGQLPGVLDLQRAAGNAAVSALLAGKVRGAADQGRADIDAALVAVRDSEPDVAVVEKGLKAAKATGVEVDIDGAANKPPASALAVTKTGFGPGSVPAKKAAPAPKPTPKVSPLGKAGTKPTSKVGGLAAPPLPKAAPARAPGPPSTLSGDQLQQPPVRPTAAPPTQDPAFTAVTGQVRGVAKNKRHHPPAKAKADEAQGAALPPAQDVDTQAKAAKVDAMDAQKPGSFDKKAFIEAVKQAVEAKSPKTLKEADDFKGSGKAGQVKGEVKGLVGQGKTDQSKDIEAAADAPPDQSKAVPKPVTPMGPEAPGPEAQIPASGAVPKPAPAEQTNLQAGKHEVEGEMASANVTDEQLEKSNEPEFQQGLADKREAAAHADAAPQAYREQEATTIAQGKTDAQTTASEGAASMQSAKTGALAKLVADKGKTKTKDEAKRAEVTAKIQTLFTATQGDVVKILDGIDPEVDRQFESGEKTARASFESYVDQKMRAYKADRYGGWLGGYRWLRDKIRGMPAKVNEFYEAGRELYLKQMDGVISRIADFVGAQLNRAKARIATGKLEIANYVKSLPKDLQKVGKDAAVEIGDRFEQLESDVNDKQQSVVDSLASKYVEARGALDERIEALQEENKGLVDKAIGAIKKIINTIRELVAMLTGVLARAASVIGDIIADPVKFLGNFVGAIKDGIARFVSNITEHLKKGLMAWLFGQLEEGGVELPKTFDLKGILGMLASVFGLTWNFIRSRIVKKIGDQAMAAIEGGVSIFQKLASGGIGAVWDMIVEKLGDVKAMIIEKVQEFVITKVITAGVTWLISLLNPAAAFIKACKLIYDVVMWFVENAARIKKFIDTVLDSVTDVVKGNLGGVAAKVESALGQVVPVLIGLLANVLGLGGIGEKIRSIIQTLRKPVTKAVDFLIAQGLKLAGPIIRGLTNLGRRAKAKATAVITKGKNFVKAKADAVKAKVKGAINWVATTIRKTIKKPFTMQTGESHTVTVDIDGPEADVLIASKLAGRIRAVMPTLIQEATKAGKAHYVPRLEAALKAGSAIPAIWRAKKAAVDARIKARVDRKIKDGSWDARDATDYERATLQKAQSKLYGPVEGELATIVFSLRGLPSLNEFSAAAAAQQTRYFPSGFDVRSGLYVRGSTWKTIMNQVKARDIAARQAMIAAAGTKAARQALFEQWVKVGFIPDSGQTGYRKPETLASMTVAAAKGFIAGLRYDVDHIVPLAKHWNREGHNQSDQARFNAAFDLTRLQALCYQANRSKGGQGHGYTAPMGPEFTSQWAEGGVKNAKSIDGRVFVDKKGIQIK